MKKSSVVASAPADQRLSKPLASSGQKGKPLDFLLSKVEEKYSGIEQEIGISSAAVRAGRQVREMRLAKGLTQAQLAAALGWDQVRISNIERGEGILGPTFDVLQKVAAACGYEIEFKPRRSEKPPSYADVLQGIATLVADAGSLSETMIASPRFAAACVGFAKSFGTMKTHFLAVDERHVKREMRHIPYLEMAAQGKRMVMVPVLVEEAAGRTKEKDKKGSELEVKLAFPGS